MTTGNRNPNANNATGATLTASSGKKRKKDTSNGEDNSNTKKREDYETEYWQQKIKEGIEMNEKYKMNPSQIADKIGMNQRTFRRILKRYYTKKTTMNMKRGPKPKNENSNSTKNNDESNVDVQGEYTNDDDNCDGDNHENDSDDDDEDDDSAKVINFFHDLQQFLQQDTTNNADLVKRILELHGQQNGRIYDLTHGDGKFWRGDVLNSLELFVPFDRFKNRETNPQRHGNVYPLKLAGKFTEEGNFFKGATGVVIDPPYLPYGGKHNARNCNLTKSSSFLKFAFAYGIDVYYTINNIVEFYIDCFEIVEKSLCDKGEHLVLVKCMDFDSTLVTEIVGSIAVCKGYSQVGYYPLIRQGKKQSVMLCYQRMSDDQRKNSFLRRAMGKRNIDNELKQYKKRSADDYKERTKSTIDDTRRWVDVCGKILNMGVHCRPETKKHTLKLMNQYGWVREENGWRSTNEIPISSELASAPGTDLQEFYRDRCFENTMIQNCCFVLWHDLLEKEYNGNIPTDRNIKIQYAKTLFDKKSSKQLNTENSHGHIKKNVEIIMKEYFEKH